MEAWHQQLLWAGGGAFACSLVLTPIVRDIFRSYRVVDQPDQGRKVHVHPIPRVGGIAIAIAWVATYFLLRPAEGEVLARQLSVIRNLIPAAMVVFATGLIDDFFGLKPWQKLLGQLVAALMACWAGVMIDFVGGSGLPVAIAIPLTVFWLLLCTNAVNLVDGLDGLAAGVGLFSTLTIFAAALVHGNVPLAFATLPLAGALLGFLCFNFNPATVFLGDGGSLLIGFLLGCFGVLWTQKMVTLLGITAPLMTLCIPLLDVLLAIVRRWLRNQPIFGADRGHIHHRLLDRGLTTKQAVFLLYGFCGLCAVFSIAQSLANDVRVAGLVVAGFVAMAWIGIRYLGYTEFILARQMLSASEFQRSVSGHIKMSSFEKKILAADSLEDCWAAILEVRETFGFAAVRMYAGGQLFEIWPPAVAGPGFLTLRVMLNSHDYLELARPLGSKVLPMVVAPFVDMLAATLTTKLGNWRNPLLTPDPVIGDVLRTTSAAE